MRFHENVKKSVHMCIVSVRKKKSLVALSENFAILRNFFVKSYGGAANANIKIQNFSPNGMCVQSFVSFRVRFAPQKRVSFGGRRKHNDNNRASHCTVLGP